MIPRTKTETTKQKNEIGRIRRFLDCQLYGWRIHVFTGEGDLWERTDPANWEWGRVPEKGEECVATIAVFKDKPKPRKIRILGRRIAWFFLKRIPNRKKETDEDKE